MNGCSKKSFHSILLSTACLSRRNSKSMQHVEISSLMLSGKRILPSSIAFLSYSRFEATNGGKPTISSNMMTPTDQRSAFSVYFSCLCNSGAM